MRRESYPEQPVNSAAVKSGESGKHRLMCLSAAFILLAFSGCQETNVDVEALAAMEFLYEQDSAPDSPRILEIKEDILKNRAVLEEKINAAGNVGRLYRALGLEYQKLGLFGLAMGAYEKAIEIENHNPILLYKAGLMAAQVSETAPDATAQELWLDKAIRYYDLALSFDPNYRDALYALSVVRLFEREDIDQARDLVQRLLVVEPKDIPGLFLAGRIAVLDGDTDRAIDYYEQIIRFGTTDEEKKTARENQEELLRSR